MTEDDWVTLVVPQGAELANVSFGTTAYPVWHHAGKWLVRMPLAHARSFCQTGGFYRYDNQDVRAPE